MWWYLVFEVSGSMPRILTKFQKNELGNLPRYVLKVTWKSTSFQLYHMHHTYRRILAVTQTCICKPKHRNNWPYLLKFHSHTGFPFEVSNSMFYVFWGGYEIMVTYIYLLLFLQKQQLAGECACFFVSNSQECSWWNCLSTNVCCKYICLKKQELVAQLLVFTASAPKWNARLLCYHVLKHTFLLGWVGGSKKHNMFILFCWKTYCSPTSSS